MYVDIQGQKFHRLTVVKTAGKTNQNSITMFLCSNQPNQPTPTLAGVFHLPTTGGRMQHILPALIPLVETARVDYTPATTGETAPHTPHQPPMAQPMAHTSRACML